MIVTEILIPTSDDNGELRGVLAVPDGPGPFPAAIMVHEVFGIEENMQAQIERLCSVGYLVLMPDLFSRGGARRCLMATFRALTAGHGQAFDDVAAARNLVLSRADCTGKIGVIGFCMGGGFALQLANHGFDAASVNYGMMPTDLEASLTGACPIIGSYGGKDDSLKGAAVNLEQALSKAGIAHDIKEYPNANHAFMNTGPAGPAALRPIMSKVFGMRPYPAEAADAWHRIEDFFAKHLS